MTNIKQAIDDLIDAADRLVNKKDCATPDVTLTPYISVKRLEIALERAQKAIDKGRP